MTLVPTEGDATAVVDAAISEQRDWEPAAPERAFDVLDTFYVRRGKRLFDIVLSSLLLVVLAVPMLLIACAVRVYLGAGVLYKQARVGVDGATFTVFKYRTMHPDRRAIPVGAVGDGIPDRRITHKTLRDPRHTGLGRFLRRSSLDELPQLLNVVRGDMSLIGPRPELVHLVERMTPQQKLRHAVRPGVTGPWQITARGTLLTGDAILTDLHYISHISFRADLWLLLKTPAVALFGRTGA